MTSSTYIVTCKHGKIIEKCYDLVTIFDFLGQAFFAKYIDDLLVHTEGQTNN